ncbi:hypothetical protein LZ30DRAFT_216186 [Colletotrichum cereale]|nr:hypothetical protein LZ30DRAFT_216186 [Colletotrichum cereale]
MYQLYKRFPHAKNFVAEPRVTLSILKSGQPPIERTHSSPVFVTPSEIIIGRRFFFSSRRLFGLCSTGIHCAPQCRWRPAPFGAVAGVRTSTLNSKNSLRRHFGLRSLSSASRTDLLTASQGSTATGCCHLQVLFLNIIMPLQIRAPPISSANHSHLPPPPPLPPDWPTLGFTGLH